MDHSTANQILLAAAETFARKGYQATTMDDIAAAAGVARRSIYHHFDSKKAILESACLVQARSFMEEVSVNVPCTGSFPDYIGECLYYVVTQAPKTQLFMLEVTRGTGVDPVAFYFGNDELIGEWIAFFQPAYLEAVHLRELPVAIALDKLVNWFGRICTSFLQYPLAGETPVDIRESIDLFFTNALRYSPDN